MAEDDAGPIDYIEMQSISTVAQGIAKRLVDRHGNDFDAIEKVVKRLKAQKEFIEEILWAVRWMLQPAKPV